MPDFRHGHRHPAQQICLPDEGGHTVCATAHVLGNSRHWKVLCFWGFRCYRISCHVVLSPSSRLYHRTPYMSRVRPENHSTPNNPASPLLPRRFACVLRPSVPMASWSLTLKSNKSLSVNRSSVLASHTGSQLFWKNRGDGCGDM